MSLPADLQRFAPIAAAALVAVVGLFFVSHGIGGGSGGGSSSSAQQVIDKAFSTAPQKGTGARITGSMAVNVSGPEAAAAGLSQPVTVSLDGVANAARPGQQPSFDIGVKVTGSGQKQSVRVISTGKRGFIDVNGRAYELPAAQIRRLSSQQGKGTDPTALRALGVDPTGWISNVTDAGTAQVGGEQTSHVTADVDVQRMLDDVLKVTARTGQAQQVPPNTRDAVRKAVKDAKLDVFAAKSDGTLRRVVATVRFEAPGPQGKALQGDARFDLQVTEVGKPQTVAAPRHAVPFTRFDQGSLGLGSLSGLGGASQPKPAQTAPKHSTTKHSASGRPSRRAKARQTRRARAQAYVKCVQQAADVPALAKCQPLLP